MQVVLNEQGMERVFRSAEAEACVHEFGDIDGAVAVDVDDGEELLEIDLDRDAWYDVTTPLQQVPSISLEALASLRGWGLIHVIHGTLGMHDSIKNSI